MDINIDTNIIIDSPFINFVNEDKSEYPLSKTKGFIDADNDFRIGSSGGFLMNIDFTFVDTHLFSYAASNYNKYSKLGFVGKEAYAGSRVGSKKYHTFWERETIRRRNGMTAKCKLTKHLNKTDLHISGDHYAYLNYSRMSRVPTSDEKELMIKRGDKRKKILGFPTFRDGDYWTYKIDEFARNNDFNIVNGKARRKGYSYKRASQGANNINDNPNVTLIMVAYDIGYLTDSGATADMLKINLDWFENNTYWKRGYISEDITNIETGYKKKGQQHKRFGYRSKALSVTCRTNTSVAIGKDASEIDFEEAGKNKNLQKTLNTTLSSTEAGSEKVGIIRVFGTAGAEEADWTDFSSIFYNPIASGMLPMENVWDKNSRSSVCGFFHPQILCYEGFIDVDGNSDLVGAYNDDIKVKAKQESIMSIEDFMIFCGQRANSPEEAFNSGTENIFNSPEMMDHLSRVRHDPELAFYRDGIYVLKNGVVDFKLNSFIRHGGTKVHDYITKVPFNRNEDFTGCVREYYSPHRDKNDIIPNDLYYIVLDTVGKSNTSKKEVSVKHSLGAFHVMMYPNNIVAGGGDIIVASYAGRPLQMEDTDRLAWLACKRWNAKLLVETDRGNTVANFRRWGSLHLLIKDPTTIINEKLNPNINANYGINIGGGSKSKDALIYIKDWLYEPVSQDKDEKILYRFHYIYDLPLLLELVNYNDNGNFDRLSALKLAMFQRQAYRVLRRKPKENATVTTLGRIGIIDKLLV